MLQKSVESGSTSDAACYIFVLAFALFCGISATADSQTPPTSSPGKTTFVPEPLRPGWDQIDERLVFMTVRLSSVEASVDAVNKALKSAGYSKDLRAEDVEHARKGNELMDRNGGGPVPWQDFYGRTAQDFYFHPGSSVQMHSISGSDRETNISAHRTSTPIAINRPPQLDYIYKANSDSQQRAEAAVAELGGKIDKLLERRRNLESEQSALWSEIAFQAVASRDLSSKPLYRFCLKNTQADVASDHIAAAQAACVFVRTVNQLMDDAQKDVENDPGVVFHEFSGGITEARKTLSDYLAEQESIAMDLSDDQSKISKVAAVAKRIDDLVKNIDESYRLVHEGDIAGDDQRKNTFRGQLQNGLLDTADTLVTANQCVLDVVKDWKLVPDVKRPATEPSAHLDVPLSTVRPKVDTGGLQNPAVADDQKPAASTNSPPPQSEVVIPSIAGVWQETPDARVTVSQTKGEWTAQCSYTRKGFGEIRWEIANGTITADGKIEGTLHHTKAPVHWTMSQDRTGKLSADGKTISGSAFFDKAEHPFTWTRVDQPVGP